jgi:hypothetical protein|tara:strand:- start:2116 stop:2442 length:327 start_codon:yes stop_codon:yes gene_type:complete
MNISSNLSSNILERFAEWDKSATTSALSSPTSLSLKVFLACSIRVLRIAYGASQWYPQTKTPDSVFVLIIGILVDNLLGSNYSCSGEAPSSAEPPVLAVAASADPGSL